MRVFLYSVVIFLAAATPVLASGGLSCTGDDDKARFSIESGVTHGLGGPVFNFRGELEILDTSVADDLRKTVFQPDNLPQYWLDSHELRLLIYRERPNEKPHGYVELTILTKVGEEGVYDGQYQLKIYDTQDNTSAEGTTVTIDGTVSCFVE